LTFFFVRQAFDNAWLNAKK